MRLIILGAGGYGRTVADVALQTGRFDEIRFLDDHGAASDLLGACCDFIEMIGDETAFYPAFGSNETRISWLHRVMESGGYLPVIIHPAAYVSPTVKIGQGTVIMPHAVVNSNCEIKAGCIINCGAIVDHDCVLEEGVHVCLGAVIKAENRIPCRMKIETGEIIRNRTYPL